MPYAPAPFPDLPGSPRVPYQCEHWIWGDGGWVRTFVWAERIPAQGLGAVADECRRMAPRGWVRTWAWFEPLRRWYLYQDEPTV